MGNTGDDMRNLDRYLWALRTMPNAAGAAVRAMDHADAAELGRLEVYLSGDLAGALDAGEDRPAWIARHASLARHAALAGLAHDDAPNRLAQAIANLIAAGLWPWEL